MYFLGDSSHRRLGAGIRKLVFQVIFEKSRPSLPIIIFNIILGKSWCFSCITGAIMEVTKDSSPNDGPNKETSANKFSDHPRIQVTEYTSLKSANNNHKRKPQQKRSYGGPHTPSIPPVEKATRVALFLTRCPPTPVFLTRCPPTPVFLTRCLPTPV